ncbi:MAG: DUF5612 domain-containing protein, partial [Bryobacteraceae bacterium]
MANERVGLLIEGPGGPGVLHQLTGVIARHQGDVTLVEILENTPERSRIYFEVDLPGAPGALAAELEALPVVR